MSGRSGEGARSHRSFDRFAPASPLADSLGLFLFNEDDAKAAFAASASAELSATDVDGFLEALYHGPPPAAPARRLRSAVSASLEESGSSGLPFAALWSIIQGIQKEEEAAEAAAEAKARTGEFSAQELRDKRQHHVRPFEGPKETLIFPLTCGHDAGWDISAEDTVESTREIRPKRKCAETKFAEKLLRAGELL